MKRAPQTCTLRRAFTDPKLFAAALGDLASWRRWLAILLAAFGEELTAEERELFEAAAGVRSVPKRRVRELWAAVSRGGGKSRMAALIAVYLAVAYDWTKQLAPGERGLVMLVAPTMAQGAICLNYARGYLEASPVLVNMLIEVTADEIILKGNVRIQIRASNFRSTRGFTLLGVVVDEVAFLRSDDGQSLNPDIELYRAVMHSLVRSGGLMVAISSPYRKTGLLYTKHREYFGKDSDDCLVVTGRSLDFNPTLDEAAIDRATADDPAAAVAEYGGQFRQDLQAFLDEGDIDRAINYSRPTQIAPRPNTKYAAYMDPSGGRHDMFTCAIGHTERDGRIVVDCLMRRHPPFDPNFATAEICSVLKQYHVPRVMSDNYAAEWSASAVKANGIHHTQSELTASELYLEGLPHFTRGLIEVPNDQVLVRELRLLERRTSRTGRDAVGHPPGGSDDCANAVFGLAYLLKGKSGMRSVPAANYTAAIQASNNALRGRPDPRAIDMYAISSGRR